MGYYSQCTGDLKLEVALWRFLCFLDGVICRGQEGAGYNEIFSGGILKRRVQSHREVEGAGRGMPPLT